MKTVWFLAILLFGLTFVHAQTEQAPIVEKEFDYKDWTYPQINGDGKINLRQFAKGKKLVLVVYFAPWCPNWKYEAPFVQRLYEKYKDYGFAVIGVGEYDTVAAMQEHLKTYKITFPTVYESDSRQAKQQTLHYEYRKLLGDRRNWGSPFNIFLLPENLKAEGEVISKKMFVSMGELIEKEAENFVREKLGLTKDDKKAEKFSANKKIEICEPSTQNLKRP
jgi:peroxiredoxin